MSQTLLIELLTEELPPKALNRLGTSFATTIFEELAKLGFVAKDGQSAMFASPRRLAVSISAVAAIQPDQQIEKKGPAVAAGFKDGQPSPALLGFARSVGLSAEQLDQLEKGSDGKQDVFLFKTVKKGQPLTDVLSGIIEAALKKLPAPKMMRWGDRDGQFIRPVHNLTVLHGADIVPAKVLHLESGRITRGHRFLSQGEITITHADSYASQLLNEGKVVASFAERRANIEAQLNAAAKVADAQIAPSEGLLDEVSALVEWPMVYIGEFPADFLKVPQECLILSMQQHQKYFPLLDQNGKLLPRFLVVSNLETADPTHIIQGNARVLKARLSDAKFFFEQDQKQKLEGRLGRLAGVVYHNKIGSQLERVERLQKIAGEIAPVLGASKEVAQRAAYLAKADLVSDMVGEFPELQGIMGMYYARHDGEAEEVALAIEGHYHPRFAGDSLPVGPVATAVALADKLETIVGIYGIGLIPTGDKDPFALRRAALGVLRMMIQGKLPLQLKSLLRITEMSFPAGVIAPNTVDSVHGFMLDRLKGLLTDKGFTEFLSRERQRSGVVFAVPAEAGIDPSRDVLDAILALELEDFRDLADRIRAVETFKKLPEAQSLIAANKRIRNILKKVEGEIPAINAALFAEAAESALFAEYAKLAPTVEALLKAGDFTGALKALAALKAPVDAFFDGVMVMADDLAVRGNRLALLHALAGLMNRVAELSLLAE